MGSACLKPVPDPGTAEDETPMFLHPITEEILLTLLKFRGRKCRVTTFAGTTHTGVIHGIGLNLKNEVQIDVKLPRIRMDDETMPLGLMRLIGTSSDNMQIVTSVPEKIGNATVYQHCAELAVIELD